MGRSAIQEDLAGGCKQAERSLARGNRERDDDGRAAVRQILRANGAAQATGKNLANREAPTVVSPAAFRERLKCPRELLLGNDRTLVLDLEQYLTLDELGAHGHG